MSFETDFAASAWPVLLAQFGETVIYRPDAGAPRTLTNLAVVTRNPPGTISDVTRAVLPELIVEVENHSTRGITLAELDTGKDTINVAVRYGGELEMKQIGKLIPGTGATLRFEVH